MSHWIPQLDLSTIPDDLLHSEVARRRSAKRGDRVGGRPQVNHRCPDCGLVFGARELRAHRPQCPDRKR